MGKQTTEVDPSNPFSAFTPKAPQQIGASSFAVKPFTKEEARGLFEKTGAFKGDSQYDTGLTIGMNQALNRAENQPWYDELGNSVAKVIPSIGLGIIENAGYLGELLDSDQDYTNALTEFASKKRQGLEQALPTYRKNPNDITSFSDSAWWFENGEGLVESIGEFLVTGAGVGSTLGKSSKLLANILKGTKAYRDASIGLNALSTLGTASTLAYTEGAMSGAQIYKEVYNDQIDNYHVTPEQAKKKASEAASKTVQLNTIINTGLNITSVIPLLKTFDNLYSTARLGLSRLPEETLLAYSARLGKLAVSGVKQASVRDVLVREAIQEGLEEDVNVFAEQEGRITGGLIKNASSDPFTRFLEKATSEEGLLNFALGAIGGIAQTAGMDYLPYRNYTKDGETIKVGNHQLNKLQDNEVAKRYIATLQEDISYLTSKQKDLSSALEKGDRVAADKAKNELFNIATLKSIREGVAEEFGEDLRKVALIDNVQVGEDGKTEAMRKGYADSTQDNDYKNKALQKASDLKVLGDEYNNLRQVFDDKFVADQVFRKRLDIYSQQSLIEDYSKQNTLLTSELLKTSTEPGIESVIEASANVSSFNHNITTLEQKKNKTTYEDKLLKNLKASQVIEDKLLQDQLTTDPSLKAKLEQNKGIVQQLAIIRTPLLLFDQDLKQLKAEYNDLINNKAKTEKEILEIKDKLSKKIDKVQAEKKEVIEKTQENTDLKEASQKKQNTYREDVGEFRIQTNSKGGFDVIDNNIGGVIISNHPTVELAKAAAQEANKKRGLERTKQYITNPPPTGEIAEEPPIISVPKPPEVDLTYSGKTATDTKTEKEEVEQQVLATSINDKVIGNTNKIAYRAVEKEGTEINKDYLILHSPTINVGTEVILKVAKESPFYDESKKEDVPIGVYYKDTLVGYVHLNKGTNQSSYLEALRSYIINSEKPIITTIIDKDMGIINYGTTKHKTSEAMPITKTIAVGKDNKLFTGVEIPYNSSLLKNNLDKVRDGITYAIVATPDGTEFAIPLDTSKVSKEIVESVMTAFNIFLNSEDLLIEDIAVLDEIFDKYDIDLRTPLGFSKYFKTFFYNYNLKNEDRVIAANENKEDKRWVEFTGNSIRYLKSGGAIKVDNKLQAKDVGKNTPVENIDALLEDLEQHLSKMYYNVDLEQLQDNSSVNLPLLKLSDKDVLTYTPYVQPSYIDHVKSITETTVVGQKVDDNYYTYFVSPKIYFNTNFLATPEQNNYGVPIDKQQEKITLAPTTTTKKSKKIKSMAKSLPSNKVDPSQVTDSIAEERQNYCNG